MENEDPPRSYPKTLMELANFMECAEANCSDALLPEPAPVLTLTDIEQTLKDGQQRWLHPTEIREILKNYRKFCFTPEPPIRPPSGSLFLFDLEVLRHFRKDAHNWRKKEDGKTVKETYKRLKSGNVEVHCYYAHGENNGNFQRRAYWMLEEDFKHIVLVQYLETKMSEPDGTQGGKDIVMAEPSDVSTDTEQQQKQQEEGNVDDKEKRGRGSAMWHHFTKNKVGGVVMTGTCNYCHRDIKANTHVNGTSALRKHFNICKSNPHVNSKDSKEVTLQATQGGGVSTWKFDPESIRKAFTEMVIEDELPFAFAEKSGFRRFMSVACPRFIVPSRRTTTRDVVRTYFEEKAKLKRFFKDSCQRVCLTTNCWTSQQQDGYMTVTAHFIDNDWKLHKKVISFFMVKGGIGKNLQRCLLEWDIEKVMTITTGNANSSEGGTRYMRKQMNNAKTSIAKGKYLHMRCASHIINLIVPNCLKEVDISVKRVCGAVRYIKNSTSRLNKFKEYAELEKLDIKAFLDLDICTSWNSTYLMLKAAIICEKVFARYEEEDSYYALDLCGKEGYGPLEDIDWENVKKTAAFLGHFYDLSLSVSSTLHVTSNCFFHNIGEVNILLHDWMGSEDPLCKSMAKRVKDKYDKYWGNWHENDIENENLYGREKGKEEKENMNLLIFIATTIDPRYKLSDYTKLAIEVMFGEDKGKKVCDAVNTCLRELFEEYRRLYAPSNVAIPTSDCQEPEGRVGDKMRSLVTKRMRLSSGPSNVSKSELDKYLAEDNEEDTNKFDILKWWQVNSSRYPILARLARDVLAIPISTVTSELAFRSGGQVLDDFRTSLTPFMMQALVCTQDWLRESPPIDIKENTEELARLEKELIEEYSGAGKENCLNSNPFE